MNTMLNDEPDNSILYRYRLVIMYTLHVCKQAVSLGVENYLPNCCNCSYNGQSRKHDRDCHVEPENRAALGRLEREVEEDDGQDEVERQETKSSNQGVDVPEEWEHCCNSYCCDDRY